LWQLERKESLMIKVEQLTGAMYEVKRKALTKLLDQGLTLERRRSSERCLRLQRTKDLRSKPKSTNISTRSAIQARP